MYHHHKLFHKSFSLVNMEKRRHCIKYQLPRDINCILDRRAHTKRNLFLHTNRLDIRNSKPTESKSNSVNTQNTNYNLDLCKLSMLGHIFNRLMSQARYTSLLINIYIDHHLHSKLFQLHCRMRNTWYYLCKLNKWVDILLRIALHL